MQQYWYAAETWPTGIWRPAWVQACKEIANGDETVSGGKFSATIPALLFGDNPWSFAALLYYLPHGGSALAVIHVEQVQLKYPAGTGAGEKR